MAINLAYAARYDCERCRTRCDGRSKSAYIFEDDVALSEGAEDWLLAHLANTLGLAVRKAPAQRRGLPDLEIVRAGQVVGRVEVKAQGRAFMAVQRLLPQADLLPYETVALNLSDIKRYVAQFRTEQAPTFIIWRVKRPCLGEGYWGQRLETLMAIGNRYRDRRTWRRASTASDIVDGEHRGVVVNYHFSLRELMPLEELLPLLAEL